MSDKQDKDQPKKEDFYSGGRPSSIFDFFRPPPALAQQHAQQQQPLPPAPSTGGDPPSGGAAPEHRIFECNRGAFGSQFMRHAYLYDAATGGSTGKGNASTVEAGPSRDSCYPLLGTMMQQMQAYQGLQHAVATEESQPSGAPFVDGKRSWFPGTQDCHTVKDDASRKAGIQSYTSRIGETNTRPKATTADEYQAWLSHCIAQQTQGNPCTPFGWNHPKKKDDPPPPPPTGGGMPQEVGY
jgi:hypothetical protein